MYTNTTKHILNNLYYYIYQLVEYILVHYYYITKLNWNIKINMHIN